MTPMFLLPWAHCFAGPLRLGLWRGGEGLALFHEHPGGWELLGGEEVADRLDLLGQGAECFDSLRCEVARHGQPLKLPNLGPDAWALEARRPDDVLEVTDQAPFLPLGDSFDQYLAGLSKKQRHELLRKRRRAERLASTGLSLTEGLQDLDVFLDLHRRSSPLKADFMQGKMEVFFRSLALSLERHGMLWLVTLWDGPRALASMFHIRFAGVVHLYNSGYLPEASELSPGLVLLSHCIERAHQDGLHEYDFLRGTERYKYDLGGRDRPVFRLLWGAVCDTCC